MGLTSRDNERPITSSLPTDDEALVFPLINAYIKIFA